MMVLATATKATSILTQSSGCVATLPAHAGATGQILALKIFNGPSLVAINDKVSFAGLAVGAFDIPLDQLLASSTTIDLVFDSQTLVGSAQNTAISVTIPQITGGAETTVLLEGSYF